MATILHAGSGKTPSSQRSRAAKKVRKTVSKTLSKRLGKDKVKNLSNKRNEARNITTKDRLPAPLHTPGRALKDSMHTASKQPASKLNTAQKAALKKYEKRMSRFDLASKVLSPARAVGKGISKGLSAAGKMADKVLPKRNSSKFGIANKKGRVLPVKKFK